MRLVLLLLLSCATAPVAPRVLYEFPPLPAPSPEEVSRELDVAVRAQAAKRGILLGPGGLGCPIARIGACECLGPWCAPRIGTLP